MKVEYSLNPNCSEAVFRFYTLEPEMMQYILQALADEINANTEFAPHQRQKISVRPKAEAYETSYRLYSREEIREHSERLSRGEKAPMTSAEYGNVLMRCCAGLGDNDCRVTVERSKGAFVLNIGNNDIVEDKTEWIEKVMKTGIKVEEAERSPSLYRKYARDCTCGIRFFPENYPGLITEDGARI